MILSRKAVDILLQAMFLAAGVLIVIVPGFFAMNFSGSGKEVIVFIITGVFGVLSASTLAAYRQGVKAHALWTFVVISSIAFVPLLLSLKGGVSVGELFGLSFEVYTPIFFTCVALLYISGYVYGSFFGNNTLFFLTILSASAIVLISYIVGFFLSSAFMRELFGNWFSTHLFFGLSFLFSLGVALQAEMSKKVRIGTLFLATAFACAILFSVSAELTLITAVSGIIMSAAVLASSRGKNLITALSLGVSALLFFSGIFVLPYLSFENNPFLGSFQELRPSPQSTFHVAAHAFDENTQHAVLGVPQGTFADAWVKYRPEQINNSVLWNKDIFVGYSILSTAAVMFGVSFALFLLLVMGLWAAQIWIQTSDKVLYRVFIIPVVFMWWWILTYVPNTAFIGSGVLTMGVIYGYVCRKQRDDLAARVPVKIIVWGMILILLCTGLFLIYKGTQRAYALNDLHVVRQGSSEQSRSDQITALQESIVHSPTLLAYTNLISIYKNELETLLNARADAGEQSTQLQASDVAESTLRIGNEMTELYPDLYHSWIARGHAYVIAGLLMNRAEHIETGLSAYRNAGVQAPKHPLPLFLEAQTLVLLEKREDARAPLEKALMYKPDYEDARALLMQL